MFFIHLDFLSISTKIEIGITTTYFDGQSDSQTGESNPHKMSINDKNVEIWQEITCKDCVKQNVH